MWVLDMQQEQEAAQAGGEGAAAEAAQAGGVGAAAEAAQAGGLGAVAVAAQQPDAGGAGALPEDSPAAQVPAFGQVAAQQQQQEEEEAAVLALAQQLQQQREWKGLEWSARVVPVDATALAQQGPCCIPTVCNTSLIASPHVAVAIDTPELDGESAAPATQG